MSQVLAFTKAFATAGIGGRFSKFQLGREGEWFSIHPVGADGAYCFQVKEVFNHKMFEEISHAVAHTYMVDDTLWYSYFSKAKEVLRLVCKERAAEVANTSQENRYYIDRTREVMYLTNRSNVIAVGPTHQVCTDLATNDIIKYFTMVHGIDVAATDTLLAFTKFGKVTLYRNSTQHITGITPKEFIALYGE